MYNPVLHTLSLQQAAATGWLRVSRAWLDGWMALTEQGAKQFHENMHRRAEDWHKAPFELPHGPYWTDFYGHRAHDIDVEHDV